MKDTKASKKAAAVRARLVRQIVLTFRTRATNWELNENELGKIVASEIRTVVDAFEGLLKS